MPNLVLFGGTFDPPHLGHLHTALAVQNHMQFEQFIILPCKTPVLKKPTIATSGQRVHMLELAFQPWPEFKIDCREIQRKTPSFMVETLQSFRAELGQTTSITLLIGMDAFLQLPQWYAWEKILELSHLLVMTRANTAENCIQEPLNTLLQEHQVMDKAVLLNQSFGKIYQINAGEYAISSSALRQKMGANEAVREYLPDAVYKYIKKEQLYFPSSGGHVDDAISIP